MLGVKGERQKFHRFYQTFKRILGFSFEPQRRNFHPASLADAVEFKNEESYREKLEQIKESYFGAKKPEVKEEISDEQPTQKSEVVSESMTSYVQQLAKRL